MIKMDFTEDMRKLFDGMENDNENTPDAKEHDKEESKNVSPEAESDEVVEASDEGKESGSAHEESPNEGDEGERREAVSEDSDDKEEDDIDPPAHWKKSDKEMFASLPKDSKEFLLNQSKHYQADYMKKVNDVKGLVEALDPLAEEMAKGGTSKAQAIRSLVSTHLQMRDNPAEAMKQLFVNYGVDPVDFVSKWDEISSLNDKLKEKRNEGLSDLEKRTLERNKEAFTARMAEWAKDKEYAEEVEPQMAAILTSHVNSGKQPPHIDDMYEEACWANPRVRKIMIKNESLKTSVEEKKRLDRSKRAASASIQKETDGTTTSVGSSDMTQREEIAQLMSKAG